MPTASTEPIHVLIADDGFRAVAPIAGTTIASGSDAAAVIQAALDASLAVQLGLGAFPIDRPLRLRAQGTLAGYGRASRLVVRGDLGIAADGVASVTVRDLTVDGQNGAVGIRFTTVSAGTITACLVRGCGIGIHLEQHSALCRIAGSVLAGNRRHLLFERLREGPHGDFLPNTVHDCQCLGGGNGLICDSAVVVNCTATTFFQLDGPVIHLRNDSNSVLINACRSYQITGDVLVVEDSHELNVTGNIFCWHTGDGIVVRRSRWGTITGNEVIDTGSFNTGTANFTSKKSQQPVPPPERDAIRLEDVRAYTVSGNAVFNWDCCPLNTRGVALDAACQDVVVQGNAFNACRTNVEDAGRDNHVSGNVGRSENAKHRTDNLQSFRRELTTAMVAALA